MHRMQRARGRLFLSFPNGFQLRRMQISHKLQSFYRESYDKVSKTLISIDIWVTFSICWLFFMTKLSFFLKKKKKNQISQHHHQEQIFENGSQEKFIGLKVRVLLKLNFHLAVNLS